jgi:hypothetical protein
MTRTSLSQASAKSTPDLSPEQLHYLLMRHVIEAGQAPEIDELAAIAGVPREKAAETLQRLADIHGVILEPNSFRIWSLHPFAMIATAFWVSAGERGWWANCAWCSLAIGAALGSDIAISTRDGAEGEPLTFNIQGHRSSRPELLMHFPYPPARWWDNPYCPCGNILFFTSEQRIDEWCARHARPKGAALDMKTAIALSEAWFGDYASPDWRRKTTKEAEAIFARLRLDPQFWSLGGRFR